MGEQNILGRDNVTLIYFFEIRPTKKILELINEHFYIIGVRNKLTTAIQDLKCLNLNM